MKNDLVYLDNNSTTPIDPRVLEEMMPFLTTNYANPSSSHKMGVNTNEFVKKSRRKVAELICANENEIIFTSGATESINLVIKGIAEAYSGKGKHIVTTSTEHSAVLDTCKYLETRGFEITYLPVKNDGLLDLEVLQKSLRVDTILVSIMHVNNETGVIQPIKEISKITHEKGAVLFSDCTQSVGKTKIDVDDLGVDFLCFSAHKFYGPKGIGALYFRNQNRNLQFPALLHGGGHESGFRSGTLNVPGIVGFGKACEIAQEEIEENAQKISKMKDFLESELMKIRGSWLNGNQKNRLYNTLNIGIEGIDAEFYVNSNSSIILSNGSACSSSLIEPSHVLVGMGLSAEQANSSFRISIGKFNTPLEINIALEEIKSWIFPR